MKLPRYWKYILKSMYPADVWMRSVCGEAWYFASLRFLAILALVGCFVFFGGLFVLSELVGVGRVLPSSSIVSSAGF